MLIEKVKCRTRLTEFILRGTGRAGRPTPVPLFLAGSGGVLACVPVAGEDDKITDGPFDESCSS